MTKKYKACERWNGKQGTPEHDRFLADHQCSINYEGSAPAMEAIGVVETFTESVLNHKIRIVNFIGDGDSKSYHNVVTSDPYPGTIVKKLECIGHVQKRCGTRLRNLKKTCKDKVSVNGKEVLLLKPLTFKVINKLQNCYGIAILQNCQSGNVDAMRKAVGAVLYHSSQSREDVSQHMFCPVGVNSWCKFQVDIAKGTTTYIRKKGLPPNVRDKLIFIFQDLGREELLSKCMHGTTQNNNEALNGVIWQKCPKEVYVKQMTLEIGVCSSILNFNSGCSSIMKVLASAGCTAGYYTKTFCHNKEKRRLQKCNRKSDQLVQTQHKKLRAKVRDIWTPIPKRKD